MRIDSMTRKLYRLLLTGAVSLAAFSFPVSLESRPAGRPTTANEKEQVREAYGKLPLSFEANQGQTDSRVKFLSRGSGYTLFLTSTEAVLSLRKPGSIADSKAGHSPSNPQSEIRNAKSGAVLRMQLVGANSQPEVTGAEELPGKVNHFIGSDPAKWQTGVPTYARVKYAGVYPGVDMVYYGNQGQLEYDFIVAPGAKPTTIELAFEGADKLEVDPEGNLIIGIDGAEVIQRAPVVYQEVDEVKHTIPGRYELRAHGRVAFEVGPYDAGRTLVIDPMLIYSTYLGAGGGDWAWAIAVNPQGYAWVTGEAGPGVFPVTPGAYDTSFNGATDVFVTCLSQQGNVLKFSTFLGGNGNERGLGIALDGAGSSYVTGWTMSNNFPTTPGAFDTVQNGGTDAFVAKLNVFGTILMYSTFLGGTTEDLAEGIAVNSQGIAYVGGYTNSANFPTTPGAFQSMNRGGYDGFVARLNGLGTRVDFSTYIGGTDHDFISDITIESGIVPYVTGWTYSPNFPTTPGAYDISHNGLSDAFVTRLETSGAGLVYSTFVGGAGTDAAYAIFVGGMLASVTGFTESANFPTTAGAYDTSFNGGLFDAFVTRLDASGFGLKYSTYLGGAGDERGTDIVLDSTGFMYVTGGTASANFPVVNAIQNLLGGSYDVFVTRFNVQGNALDFSTFLGGAGPDIGWGIGLDAAAMTYVAGYSGSNNFPTTLGAVDTTFNGGGADAITFKLSTF